MTPTFWRVAGHARILIVLRPVGARLAPQLRVVVRLLVVAGHQPNALAVLAARHAQVRAVVLRVRRRLAAGGVLAGERTRHVRLHRGAQRHRTGAVVATDVMVGGGGRLVDGDVDGQRTDGGLRDVGGDDGAVEVAVALRREARGLVEVDVWWQRQRFGLGILALGGAVEVRRCGGCKEFETRVPRHTRESAFECECPR